MKNDNYIHILRCLEVIHVKKDRNNYDFVNIFF